MFKPHWGFLLTLAAMFLSLLPASSFADSQVRIVRLSDVVGTVQIDRNVGQGFESALLNVPITQGARLQTKSDGRAEVEFEDGGVLHLAPDTLVEFPQLSLKDSGARVSAVRLVEGTAYLTFAGRNGDAFTLSFGDRQISLSQAAHLRLQVNHDTAELAVFDGIVPLEDASGITEIGKKQTATFHLTGTSEVALAKKVEKAPFDDWDKEQNQYHDRYMSRSSNPSPYSYGFSDLNYYGSFMDVAGYGSCWQPYFTGAGWNPFMNGTWLWYPSGYTWVSSYPWGWMPYYYGSWNYLSSGGWCWSPGNSWGMWNAVPTIRNAPRQFMPVRPPVNPTHNRIAVNTGPRNMIPARSERATIFRGSAGLGVPRGSINNLNKLSQRADREGLVNTAIRPTTMNPGMGPRMNSPRAGSWPAGRTANAGANASPRMNSGHMGSSAPRMESSPPPAPSMNTSPPPMSGGMGRSSSPGPRR